MQRQAWCKTLLISFALLACAAARAQEPVPGTSPSYDAALAQKVATETVEPIKASASKLYKPAA